MNRCIVMALIGWVAVAVAQASPYWVAYEGDDFPENVGWARFYAPRYPAVRSIDAGALVIDSSANERIYDYYAVERQINPNPGEMFVAEWRVQADVLSSPFNISDVGMVIARDGIGIVELEFYDDRVISHADNWSLPITPGVPHCYRLTSSDMIRYTLLVDGTTPQAGVWDPNTLVESTVGWGDTTEGGGIRSVSTWDYVRFGVVPETSSSGACAMIALWLAGTRSYRR